MSTSFFVDPNGRGGFVDPNGPVGMTSDEGLQHSTVPVSKLYRALGQAAAVKQEGNGGPLRRGQSTLSEFDANVHGIVHAFSAQSDKSNDNKSDDNKFNDKSNVEDSSKEDVNTYRPGM